MVNNVRFCSQHDSCNCDTSFFGLFLNKRGQYKIQQMAFMILAIFFFFVLVGLFFVGWQITQLRSGFSQLQEEKALSALKVIADSTELNCEQSEDWCIDKDKLIAFSEHSDLYDGFFSAASIEVLMVYPRGNDRTYVEKTQTGGSSSSYNSTSPSVTYGSGRSAGGQVVGDEVDFSTSDDYEEIVTYGGDATLCPGPDCDYYVLYDNGQRDKQTFSAYVTVCETIDRSHEYCELAKLMLGVRIQDDA